MAGTVTFKAFDAARKSVCKGCSSSLTCPASQTCFSLLLTKLGLFEKEQRRQHE